MPITTEVKKTAFTKKDKESLEDLGEKEVDGFTIHCVANDKRLWIV